MGSITAADGAHIFYKDWGEGRPVVLSHGWPLNADSWEGQGNNRPGTVISEGIRRAFWLQGMQSGARNAYECIAAFSETDFRADLAAVDVPTLVIHGDDDQVVPYDVGGAASAAIVPDAKLLVYPGAPHGITDTHADQLDADLLAFLREVAS